MNQQLQVTECPARDDRERPRDYVLSLNSNLESKDLQLVIGREVAPLDLAIGHSEFCAAQAAESAYHSRLFQLAFLTAPKTEIQRIQELNPKAIVSVSEAVVVPKSAPQIDESWALRAVGALDPGLKETGKGVNVAILDTGIDLGHPDFKNRIPAEQLFHYYTESTVQDRNGHGTHMAGLVAGPLKPHDAPRYGVAPDANLWIAKVSNDGNRPSLLSVVAGMEWACLKRVQIINLSFEFAPEHANRDAFEFAIEKALDRNILVIASIGNMSLRHRSPARIAPVSSPANCPGVLAVGALRRDLAGAHDYSNGAVEGTAGRVHLAAPGEQVLSAWTTDGAALSPALYRELPYTSPAAAITSGVAALYRQRYPEQSARAIRDLLQSKARDLNLPTRDVGKGLVRVI